MCFFLHKKSDIGEGQSLYLRPIVMLSNTGKEMDRGGGNGKQFEGIPLDGFIKGTSNTKHVQQLLQLWSYYVNNPISKETNLIENIAAEICSLLLKSKSDEALVIFLLNLPHSIESCDNENILRARVHVALKQKDTKTVKAILQVRVLLQFLLFLNSNIYLQTVSVVIIFSS